MGFLEWTRGHPSYSLHVWASSRILADSLRQGKPPENQAKDLTADRLLRMLPVGEKTPTLVSAASHPAIQFR
jgi:hypothetical protein